MSPDIQSLLDGRVHGVDALSRAQLMYMITWAVIERDILSKWLSGLGPTDRHTMLKARDWVCGGGITTIF
jgi:hypothetical protein